MASDFDASAFQRGLREGGRRFLAAAARGVDVFSEQVVGDAQQLAPVATGTPAGSGTPGRSAAEVAADVPISTTDASISKTIGFNTDYAAAVHENLEAHHTQGQAKFLEAALQADAPKLAPFVGKIVEAEGF
jgi:hypothetical protein